MTRWLEREDGRVAYDDQGQGPLVVCVPGIGDLRQEYRFLSPKLVAAGFRVATMDLRGHGESTARWRDLSAEAVGRDVIALIRHLGDRHALVVGTSMAAGAAAWAAAEAPYAISGLVMIGPFVREVGAPWRARLYRLLFRIAFAGPWGARAWVRFWRSLFPSAMPVDLGSYAARLPQNLSEPGRLAALRQMLVTPRPGIEARLSSVRCPVLVVMGTRDPDFPDPADEARVVASRVNGSVEMIDRAGHYPHVEFPDETADVVLGFARRVVRNGSGHAA